MFDCSGSDVSDPHHYRDAMWSAATGVALVDLQGRWLEVNPALVQLLGHGVADMVGRPVAQFAAANAEDGVLEAGGTNGSDPDASDALQAWLAALAGGQAAETSREQRYRRADGGSAWTLTSVGLVRDAGGTPRHLVMYVHGIDALRQQLDACRAGMQALAHQQDVLAYGISHDLRAPLRAIDSFAGLLDRHPGAQLDARGRDYLARIRAAASRMGGLLDALLELSRIDRTELHLAPVDLGLQAELALAELQEAEPARAVEYSLAPDLLAVGDEHLLRLLMSQLLRNAWQFSAACEQPRIDVGGGREGALLHVTVADNGCGFDMRYAEKLFEPFQRLHGPEQGSGHGIGLAIARRIVQRHGGRLWAQSDGDHGSVFHLELPAAAPESTESTEHT